MRSVAVSVVVATHNGERYLDEQLESFVRQRRPPDEVVVGDDGSTDGTLAILDRFRRSAPFPVTVLRHERTGLAANFLRTMDVSHGDVIAFSDQDDVWDPRKIDVLLHAVDTYGADMVIHGRRTVDHDLKPMRSGHQTVRRPEVEDRLRGNVWWPAAGNAMLFRRSLFAGCDWMARPASQWSDAPMNHDDLARLLVAVRGRLVRIPDRLLLYRQHADNVAGAMITVTAAMRRRSDHRSTVRHQLAAATAWAEFFPPHVPAAHRDETERYFLDARRRAGERAGRLEAPGVAPFLGLMAGAARGHYWRRRPDGFGGKAFLQDAYFLTTGRGSPAGGAGPVGEAGPVAADR